MNIRPIELKDNSEVAQLIREVLVEFGVPKVGTAYEDEALDNMYKAYNETRKQYYVVEDENKIIGGAGIAPLQGGDTNICELQKMYFLPIARGKGIGAKMIQTCLEHARKEKFTKCYLETMPYMESAVKLYNKAGFKFLDKPLGSTGHYSCQSWMIKEL